MWDKLIELQGDDNNVDGPLNTTHRTYMDEHLIEDVDEKTRPRLMVHDALEYLALEYGWEDWR